MEAIKQEMQSLTEQLSQANVQYHSGDTSIFSDSEYDAMKTRLEALEARHPELRSDNSPIGQVGAVPTSTFKKMKHSVRMMSLANAFSSEDVEAFLESCQKESSLGDLRYSSEPKIDGLSLSLRYIKGKLSAGLTRGDGEVGEDVTRNARTIETVPQILVGAPDILEVRGEVYMSHEVFARINSELLRAGGKPYSNPRNAAAGALRQSDPEETRSRSLSFFAYSWGETSEDLGSSQSECLSRLVELGFTVNPLTRSCGSVEDLLEHYQEVMLARPDLGYDIDGMVYKVESLEDQRRLGLRSTTPRWAIAHKFPAEKAWTRIEGIDIQVGRTGALSPVARLTPINIGGVVVSNATLHNEDYIAGRDSKGEPIRDGKDLRVGDWVEVYRAGDVIPKVSDVDLARRPNDAERYAFPTACPSCSSPAVRADTDAVRRCGGGHRCPAQQLELLCHATSKGALDIAGLGDAALSELYALGWIGDVSDIFSLSRGHGMGTAEPLASRPGWGVRSAEVVFDAIEAARTTTLDRAIFSLGIPHVGQSASKALAAEFREWHRFGTYCEKIAADPGVSSKDLLSIEGIGDTISDSLDRFIRINMESIRGLGDELSVEMFEVAETQGPMSGKRVVFTGTFSSMSRSEAVSMAEAAGVKVSGSVSKKTDFLVAGENAGSKLDKAKTLGISILSEEEWFSRARLEPSE